MASSSPPPSGRDPDVDEDLAVPAPAGEQGRGGRLRPAPPPVAHAPLLLGIDTEGVENPQGPEHADEESLTGRVWGCVCGWRGTVRDVSTRPFHPRVGDGGRLRRQRLARSDRDARAELESHLTHAIRTAPPDPAGSAVLTAESAASSRVAGPIAVPGRERPRGPRRRLTLPRAPVAPEPAAVPVAAVGPGRQWDPRASAVEVAPQQPALGSSTRPPNQVTSLWPRVERQGRASPAPLEADEPGSSARDEALATAAERASLAREELEAANSTLDALVARAREEGASWRSIARATGVPHREAAARWSDSIDGASL